MLLTNRVLKLLPRHERPHRIDVLGAAADGRSATVALLLALTWGGTTYPWASPEILGLLAALGRGVGAVRLPAAARAGAVHPAERARQSGGAERRHLDRSSPSAPCVGLSVFMPLYFEAVLGLTREPSRASR